MSLVATLSGKFHNRYLSLHLNAKNKTLALIHIAAKAKHTGSKTFGLCNPSVVKEAASEMTIATKPEATIPIVRSIFLSFTSNTLRPSSDGSA